MSKKVLMIVPVLLIGLQVQELVVMADSSQTNTQNAKVTNAWITATNIGTSYIRYKGRRVALPGGRIKLKKVHSLMVRQWWGGWTGTTILARGETGFKFTPSYKWRVKGGKRLMRIDEGNPGWEGKEMGFNMELGNPKVTTFKTAINLIESTTNTNQPTDNATLEVTWHKPLENLRFTKVKSFPWYSNVKECDIPTGGYSPTETDDIKIRRKNFPVWIKSANRIGSLVAWTGSGGTDIFIRGGSPYVSAGLAALGYVLDNNIPSPSQRTLHNSHTMWRAGVVSDRNQNRGPRIPRFITPAGVENAPGVGNDSGDLMWQMSKLYKIGTIARYTQWKWTGYEYDEHGYVGNAKGSKTYIYRITDMGFYDVKVQPNGAGGWTPT